MEDFSPAPMSAAAVADWTMPLLLCAVSLALSLLAAFFRHRTRLLRDLPVPLLPASLVSLLAVMQSLLAVSAGIGWLLTTGAALLWLSTPDRRWPPVLLLVALLLALAAVLLLWLRRRTAAHRMSRYLTREMDRPRRYAAHSFARP